jgi:hypothetical protein
MLNFHDTAGREITLMFPLQDQSELDSTPYDNLINAVDALTVAGLTAVQLVTTKHYLHAADPGPYDSNTDRAHFQAKCDDATPKYFDIAAPDAAIFDATTQFVDMSNPDVVEFVTRVKEIVGNAAGSPIATVTRGTRQKIRPFPAL